MQPTNKACWFTPWTPPELFTIWNQNFAIVGDV